MSNIIGVTVGTPLSPSKIEEKIKPIKTVNGVAPDENGNVEVVGNNGADGKDGENGATFTPSMSADSVLSWTNDKGLANPDPVNIKGAEGKTPYINNGNWWIGETDTGVKAEGIDGVGISNIEKTSTNGKVDTYTISFTKGNSFSYTVSNGTDGRGISSITKTSTNGLVDTYTITYTDKTTATFTVTNGKDYVLTEADKNEIAAQAVALIDGIPSYWLSALEEGAEAINTALCTAGRNKSAFLFYSDAHWTYNSKQSPTLLKYLYKHTGINKTNFGGDIVNTESTDYDTMKYLWEWRKMLKDLPNHHGVVGNHDDGNATKNLFSEQYVYGYLLAPEETPDIVRGEGMYYYIDHGAEKTRYLYLDTAYRGMDDKQNEFIKQALISTQSGWHIVVIAHTWYMPDYDQYTVKPIPIIGLSTHAQTITTMLDAYNSRSGDYANCGGWVEFCIGGHVHRDYDGATDTGIPIILVETDSQHIRSTLSYTAGTTTEASVNGIIADYDNHKIYIVRIGRGESREVEITNYVVSYTNVLPLALAADGVSVYNGKGWKKDTRWSGSSNAEVTANDVYLTGYISVSAGDIIYLKNITMPTGTAQNGTVHFFKALDDTTEDGLNGDGLDTYCSTVRDSDGNLVQFLCHDERFKYIRIQCGGITDASIITINEPIE